MKKFNTILFAVLGIILMSSCDDFLDKRPTNSVDSASATEYTANINKTTSHGDLVFEVIFYPTRLYAWTDLSSSSNTETLYAWYNDFDGPGAPADTSRVIYTTTPNPTINSILYDSNKNVITLGDGISSASNSAITIQYLPRE
jgi:hypothetical protein